MESGSRRAHRASSSFREVLLYMSAQPEGFAPLPRFPHLTDIPSSPSIWPGSVPRGGNAEINGIVVPSRASQSDGRGSHEDKLLEAIYLKTVVNDTWE